MVDVLGHLGMALIWLAPAWFVIDRPKTAATFVGVGFWFGLLPDIDLLLSNFLPTVKHHGVFHTVLAVILFAVIVGPALGRVFKKIFGGSEWFSEAASDNAYEFGVIAVLVAGLSHIFADMLSAPDLAEAIEPFWPIYSHTIGIDVLYYNNPWVNWGLLFAGLVLNAALWWQKRDR